MNNPEFPDKFCDEKIARESAESGFPEAPVMIYSKTGKANNDGKDENHAKKRFINPYG